MEQFAAIDLGSNSFHLVVAREEQHAITIIDRERDMVRLAAGLDSNGEIMPQAAERALACLARFGQRLGGLKPENVRIVGTNALRNARNSADFIASAEQTLGFPIEIVSGIEEARLVYIGAAQTLQGDRGRRLVVDIGGGSTEIIVGDKSEPVFLESLSMGCVSSSERFFPDGKYSDKRMRRAILAAEVELEPIVAPLKAFAPKDVIGTSGTARAIDRVVGLNGWAETGITAKGLKKLARQIVKAGSVDNLKIDGLGADRQPVFAGGVAVMLAIFEAFELDFMRVSDGSLREGVLHDLIGRVLFEDRRAITVLELIKRHHIDLEHAQRVRATALKLFDQLGQQDLLMRERRLLGWAAQLHEIGLMIAHSQYHQADLVQLREIGLMIAHSQYHRHGAYVLENMDLPGFSRQEQGALSIMVRLHRRTYRPEMIEQSVYVRSDALGLMTRLLRLAMLLNRSRTLIDLPPLEISIDGFASMRLALPGAWLDAHPLTDADLAGEIALLDAAGYTLDLVRA